MHNEHKSKNIKHDYELKRLIFLNVIHIYKNIRHLRKSSGLSQNDVAEAIETNYTMIGKYESGKNDPTFEKLLALQQFFKVNLHDFVYVDLANNPSGTSSAEAKDDRLARVVTRLNLEIDKKAEDIIARADPDDLEKLTALRAEYIDKYPEIARELGIEK